MTMLHSASDVFNLMNISGSHGKPFLFLIDFAKQKGYFNTPEKAAAEGVYFDFNGMSNFAFAPVNNHQVMIAKHPVTIAEYRKGYDKILAHLVRGDSYLVNYTCRTQVNINASLFEIFSSCKAKYKLLFSDEFVVFSPEIFVTTSQGSIKCYPMKGTIDAAIPNAGKLILGDLKETAEHNTIVDLIRNDLGMVATDIKVERYRYIDTVHTNAKILLQISSEISGILPENYAAQLGDIFNRLTPAGSVSGAPKKKTLEIIDEAEIYKRGFYTGIMGYFNGLDVDSGVMIRFIEKEGGTTYFCSGGGITIHSDFQKEYNEMIDKIYVPVF